MSRQPAIWIARHGERIDFVDRTWSERAAEPYNPHLSEAGLRQARELGQRLVGEGVQHIISSPFGRALETATQVADVLDLPIKVERGAGEMLSADWFPHDPRPRNWTAAELARRYPRIDTSYQSAVDPVYPEDWPRCVERAAATMRALVERFRGDFLVIGHGATVSSMSWGLIEGTPSMKGHCCALVKIVRQPTGVNGQHWRLELDGDTSFLSYVEAKIQLQ